MKKIFYCIVLNLMFVTAVQANDLSEFFDEVVKEDCVSREFLKGELLHKKLEEGGDTLHFYSKIKLIDIVTIEKNCAHEFRVRFDKIYESIQQTEKYEIHFSVEHEDINVLIFSEKEKNSVIEALYVFVLDKKEDNKGLAIIKGDFTREDLSYLIKEKVMKELEQ